MARLCASGGEHEWATRDRFGMPPGNGHPHKHEPQIVNERNVLCHELASFQIFWGL